MPLARLLTFTTTTTHSPTPTPPHRYMPEAAAAYEDMRFHTALEAVLALTGRGNQYLEETAPWTAFKKGSEEEKAEAGKVLVAVLETARIAAIGLLPVCPALAQRLLQQLGLGEEIPEGLRWGDAAWGVLQAGQATAEPQPAFVRIEGDFVIDKDKTPVAAAAGGKAAGGKAAAKGKAAAGGKK
jgi:methionyl-tRNA synthetase